MAWTAPMTAVTGAALTASQFNTHVRDNLLETMPAKITAAGDYVVGTGTNSVASRSVASDFIHTASAETRASTTYGDLTTVGPSVTVASGARLMVWWSAAMYVAAGDYAMVSWQISGATSVSASDDYSIHVSGISAGSGNINRWGGSFPITGMNPGTHTITMKYRSLSGGTAGFNDRELIVMPF